MKTIIDRQKMDRRAQFSHTASVSGLVLLLASVVVPLFLPKWAAFSSVAMVLGLGVAMVGIYFANRWVRKPRPEDRLDKALKGLGDNYHLYHYPSLPSDHILLTPNGIVIIETVNLGGNFSYKKGRWKEAMTFGRALRYIVEEHLGDPIKAARQTEQYMQSRLGKVIDPDAAIPIKSAVVFVHPAAQLEVEDPPIPVCRVEKLRKHIVIDSARLAPDVYEKIAVFLEELTKKK